MHDPFDALVRLLSPLTETTPATSLHPSGYFLARSGVLTLAFTGFPWALLELKDSIDRTVPNLAVEYAGSRWPKVTLGALRSPEPLSKDEVEHLREVADRAALALADSPPVRVDRLELISFACRSLERRLRAAELPLRGAPPSRTPAIPDAQVSAVNAVQGQFRFDRLDGYHEEIVRPGYREAHYRSPHSEYTLVYPLSPVIPGLDEFLEDVDQILPDRYAWFSPESRHVTIRALGSRAQN